MTADTQRDVVFLGLAERAAYVREGNTNLFKWNVLGLKHIILSHIYPLHLSGWSIGLAFLSTVAGREYKFQLIDESGKELGFINLLGTTASPNDPEAALGNEGPTLLIAQEGWTTAFLPLNNTGIIIPTPGIYYLRRVLPDGEEILGQLRFAVISPSPLTPERIAAIRADPTAMKAVRVELGCKQCPAKCRTYVALDRSEKSEADGWVWYQALPDRFTCECGKTTMPLDLIRQNLHGLLGLRHKETTDVDFVPLYERSSLETLRSHFTALLESTPKEELLQQFMEENPILLHQFPALQLFSKPPILTFFVADFAVLTPKKELLLIELEKTTTKLMKKDGGVAAALSHAFDQVGNWLHVVDEHRLAVLDSLKIDREDVSGVRGVVIAGRDAGHDAHHLRKLKGEDRGRMTLFTYDDLLFALDSLIRRIDSL